MLNLLEKSTSAINKIATAISASGLIIATVCLFLQVIFRVISFTATWTGEIARYAFMVTVFYGMAAAIDRGLNLVITMFSDKLSEKKKFIYSIFTKVLFVFFFSIITNGVLRAANVASNNNQSFEAFTNV